MQNMRHTLYFACIFKFMSLYMHNQKKNENEVHTSRTNMQQCAPPQGSTLLIVPQCLAAARGRGFDSDGCDALPVAAILQWHPLWPKLWRLVFTQHWTKIRTICSPCRSCACTNTFRTTDYKPGISWVVPVYLVIYLVNP